MGMNNQIKPTTTTPTTMLSEQGNGKRLKQDGVNLLSYNEVVEVVEKVLKRNPDSIRKYVHGEKKVLIVCYLAGMVLNACDYKADPQMIDKILLEKLQNIKVVDTKGTMLHTRI